MSIQFRRQVRLLALTALQSIVGVDVVSPGDWETPPDKMPQIKVRVESERKLSVARTLPEFTTTVTLEVGFRVSAASGEDAQDRLEALGQLIEFALLGYSPLIAVLQQVGAVNSQSRITADGKLHLGECAMQVDLEGFEVFDPTEIDPSNLPALNQLNIHLDLQRPFDRGVDASGNPQSYPNPPFPTAVVPAPRTEGPDGRDEGTLQINLP